MQLRALRFFEQSREHFGSVDDEYRAVATATSCIEDELHYELLRCTFTVVQSSKSNQLLQLKLIQRKRRLERALVLLDEV